MPVTTELAKRPRCLCSSLVTKLLPQTAGRPLLCSTEPAPSKAKCCSGLEGQDCQKEGVSHSLLLSGIFLLSPPLTSATLTWGIRGGQLSRTFHLLAQHLDTQTVLGSSLSILSCPSLEWVGGGIKARLLFAGP